MNSLISSILITAITLLRVGGMLTPRGLKTSKTNIVWGS